MPPLTNKPPSVAPTSRPTRSKLVQLKIPIPLPRPSAMQTCTMQLKLYIPFQPRMQTAVAVTEKKKQSSKDAPIVAATISKSNKKAIKPYVVLAPLHITKKKEPAPAKLTKAAVRTNAGGNKQAISLLSIVNPPKCIISLPPFSALPEKLKKKNGQHKHAKRQRLTRVASPILQILQRRSPNYHYPSSSKSRMRNRNQQSKIATNTRIWWITIRSSLVWSLSTTIQ